MRGAEKITRAKERTDRGCRLKLGYGEQSDAGDRQFNAGIMCIGYVAWLRAPIWSMNISRRSCSTSCPTDQTSNERPESSVSVSRS